MSWNRRVYMKEEIIICMKNKSIEIIQSKYEKKNTYPQYLWENIKVLKNRSLESQEKRRENGIEKIIWSYSDKNFWNLVRNKNS